MDKKAEAVRLRKSGKSIKDVALLLGIGKSSVSRYTVGEKIPPSNVLLGLDNLERIKLLIKEGYSNSQISDRTGFTRSWVSNIRRKQEGYKGSYTTPTGTRIKPKIDLEPKLQKGMAKINKRDEVFANRLETGRPINILYSDISSNPVVKATIFSRHGGSDYEAVAIWAKKYNKKSFALLNK